MATNPAMSLSDALELLCGAHIRDFEDDLYQIQMPLYPVGYVREEDYAEAWAAVRRSVLAQRNLRQREYLPEHELAALANQVPLRP